MASLTRSALRAPSNEAKTRPKRKLKIDMSICNKNGANCKIVINKLPNESKNFAHLYGALRDLSR